MSVEIKKRDNLWILKVNEEFAFDEDEFKMMEAHHGTILEIKKRHGDLHQKIRNNDKKQTHEQVNEMKKLFRGLVGDEK